MESQQLDEKLVLREATKETFLAARISLLVPWNFVLNLFNGIQCLEKVVVIIQTFKCSVHMLGLTFLISSNTNIRISKQEKKYIFEQSIFKDITNNS